MNRDQLLRRIEKAWTDFESSYAGLTEVRLRIPGVCGEWSIKDIIAHVTVWEEEALTHLPTVLAGRRPPRYAVLYGGIDAFNAHMMEVKKNLPLKKVLRQRDATHRRLIEFLQGVPQEQFIRETRFRRRLRLDTYGHYVMHAAAIQRWRKTDSSTR